MEETKYAFAKDEEGENGLEIKTIKSKKRQFTGLERKLIAVAVVLAICTILFLVLFVVFASRTRPAPAERFKNTKAAVIAASGN